jgi:gamma-glutamylcysteine synthetase
MAGPVCAGKSPAGILLEKYHNEWDQQVDKIYEEYCYWKVS